MKDLKVLVTGAGGFVGRALVQQLAGEPACKVLASTRSLRSFDHARIESFASGTIDGETPWAEALNDVDVVVHMAARAHVLQERSEDPLAEFRRVNVDGTLHLARQAARAGVKRFVFMSTIGVNGATTESRPFTAEDSPHPHSPYAQSKYEAELGLRALADQTGIELVIIRPPLVYGPAAPGNFGALVRWIRRGVPLPLGAIQDNRRSLVALDNLVDLILTCIEHPGAANQTFLVSDGEDLSTAELIRRMARVMDRPARLIPVPVWVLEAGGALLGKRDVVDRLCGSLQVDIRKSRDVLGWAPSIRVDEGLRRAMAEWRA